MNTKGAFFKFNYKRVPNEQKRLREIKKVAEGGLGWGVYMKQKDPVPHNKKVTSAFDRVVWVWRRNRRTYL